MNRATDRIGSEAVAVRELRTLLSEIAEQATDQRKVSCALSRRDRRRNAGQRGTVIDAGCHLSTPT